MSIIALLVSIDCSSEFVIKRHKKHKTQFKIRQVFRMHIGNIKRHISIVMGRFLQSHLLYLIQYLILKYYNIRVASHVLFTNHNFFKC